MLLGQILEHYSNQPINGAIKELGYFSFHICLLWPFVSSVIFSHHDGCSHTARPRHHTHTVLLPKPAEGQSFSHGPFQAHNYSKALRLQKTFLYSSIPSSTPIINKEEAQNTTVFVTSRLNGTKEGKYWNESRVNISQHEGVVQPKGQDSTFVKSKPNPRKSNFNLWTTELVLVHWLRMFRLFGNLFALG